MQEDLIVTPIKTSLAKRVIGKRLPELTVRSIRYLGGGSSSAFSINDALIAKFPKLGFEGQHYGDFLELFRREKALNAVASELVLPHEIIKPLEQLPGPTSDFPGPIFLYQYFSGAEVAKGRFTPVKKNKLAALLGDFLAKLHAIETNQAVAFGLSNVSSEEIKTGWHRQYKYYRQKVFHLLKPSELQWFTALYEEFLKKTAAMKPKVVLTHGDFGPENVLVPKEFNRLQVIDFEDMALGDAATDFCVWYWHFGSRFVSRMLRNYRAVDRDFLVRIGFYARRLPLIYFDLYEKSGNKKFLRFARELLRLTKQIDLK